MSRPITTKTPPAEISLTTLRILASVERRLNTLLRIENQACGFDEEIRRANLQRDRLMEYLEREIEALVQFGPSGKELL